MATLRDVMGVTHDSVLLPGHQVVHTGLNGEVAARAGVDLLSLGGTNRLHGVGVATLCFGSPEPGLEALEVERLPVIALRAPTPVIAGHA